jgi:hypothetical protein
MLPEQIQLSNSHLETFAIAKNEIPHVRSFLGYFGPLLNLSIVIVLLI